MMKPTFVMKDEIRWKPTGATSDLASGVCTVQCSTVREDGLAWRDGGASDGEDCWRGR
jgi:hypothetical protein